METPRIVLDTASYITAMRSPRGAARQLPRSVAERRVKLVMDLKLALEYRDVALRPRQLAACGLTSVEMLRTIEAIEDYAEPAETDLKLRPLSSDPNDDMIIELAVFADVDAIVTGNTRHFEPFTQRFAIAVLTPAEMLQQIKMR